MKKLGIVLILSILLVSCSKTEPIGKYQAINTLDGHLIIINTTNGEGEVFNKRVSNTYPKGTLVERVIYFQTGKIVRPEKKYE
jgi:hypothetical protein